MGFAPIQLQSWFSYRLLRPTDICKSSNCGKTLKTHRAENGRNPGTSPEPPEDPPSCTRGAWGLGNAPSKPGSRQETKICCPSFRFSKSSLWSTSGRWHIMAYGCSGDSTLGGTG